MSDAVTSHLDLVAKVTNWGIIAGAAVAWAGFRDRAEIEALGMKIERQYAFNVVAALFLIANLTVTIAFLRIGDLLTLVPDAQFPVAATKLATYAWVLNPFSYFGDSWIAKIYSAEGLGLLIVTWWLANTALFTLSRQFTGSHGLLMGLFLLIGLSCMLAIARVDAILLDRADGLDASLAAGIRAQLPEHLAGSFLGIVGGVLLYSLVERSQLLRTGTRLSVRAPVTSR